LIRAVSNSALFNSAAYNKAQRLPERRKMMQAWADYLDGLREGANVVPIRRAS
jgi:hypothetical protein